MSKNTNGVICPNCKGLGSIKLLGNFIITCDSCNGLGGIGQSTERFVEVGEVIPKDAYQKLTNGDKLPTVCVGQANITKGIFYTRTPLPEKYRKEQSASGDDGTRPCPKEGADSGIIKKSIVSPDAPLPINYNDPCYRKTVEEASHNPDTVIEAKCTDEITQHDCPYIEWKQWEAGEVRSSDWDNFLIFRIADNQGQTTNSVSISNKSVVGEETDPFEKFFDCMEGCYQNVFDCGSDGRVEVSDNFKNELRRLFVSREEIHKELGIMLNEDTVLAVRTLKRTRDNVIKDTSHQSKELIQNNNKLWNLTIDQNNEITRLQEALQKIRDYTGDVSQGAKYSFGDHVTRVTKIANDALTPPSQEVKG